MAKSEVRDSQIYLDLKKNVYIYPFRKLEHRTRLPIWKYYILT